MRSGNQLADSMTSVAATVVEWQTAMWAVILRTYRTDQGIVRMDVSFTAVFFKVRASSRRGNWLRRLSHGAAPRWWT
ncbi:hypothetical protein EXS56_01045 [Candidatus Kaiserbacteria bacterium]|nr:hypothetical protein [Candidatus Kaiserbacteria bacterium]